MVTDNDCEAVMLPDAAVTVTVGVSFDTVTADDALTALL
jgi:hypothetical protein